MTNADNILIVGGYGVVGSLIARDLAPDYPSKLIVGGRHADRAGQLALELGNGARARAIDVTQPSSIASALDGVGTIVSCIDQPEPYLLHAAIERGLGYTDIAPHLMTRRPTDAMREAATRSGARIVLGAGLAPGISSMLARVAVDRLGGEVERLNSNVLLSVGDAFGEASSSYIIQEIAHPYAVWVDGQERRVLPFAQPTPVQFPPPLGRRTAYLFPFSDQVFFPQTFAARTALTRLSLDPPWLGPALAVLVRLRVTTLLARRRSSGGPAQRLTTWLQRRNAGRDWWGLVVEVEGPNGSVRASLAGHRQADATALGAAAIARSIIDGQVPEPGIWLAEQVVPPEPFLRHLALNGLAPRFEAVRPANKKVQAMLSS